MKRCVSANVWQEQCSGLAVGTLLYMSALLSAVSAVVRCANKRLRNASINNVGEGVPGYLRTLRRSTVEGERYERCMKGRRSGE